jgi:membrane-bound lytic murein transglycosylase MltF
VDSSFPRPERLKSRRARLRAAITLVSITLCLGLTLAPSARVFGMGYTAPSSPQLRHLSTTLPVWTGDFDTMLTKHAVRVVAPYSRSLYYVDEGRERGIAAGLLRDFELFLNQKYKPKLHGRPITVAIAAITRDQLLPSVAQGVADIAVGDLTITPDRLKLVDMPATQHDVAVHEILVTGPKSPQIGSVDDLSGKTVHVRRTSSYYDSLLALNDRLRQAGKSPVTIILVPNAVEDEDLMEMLNAGVVQAIVVDDWKAKLWAPALPKLRVHSDIVLRDAGRIGWAVRKNSPLLTAEIRDFFDRWLKTHGTEQYRLAKAIKQMKQIGNPTEAAELKRFEATVTLFDRYGTQYGFDPLMLTAQGYQESQLDQNKHSHVGAVGVMQLMPATGTEMKVGDIHVIDANIHAGAKYMDQLMAQNFSDTHFTEANRTLFAFAAYNCGAGNVAKARKEAAKRGLNPNVWFNNVEIVIADKIGMETTTYVRNIYKYYVAYKLIQDAKLRTASARSGFSAGKD